MNADWHPEDVKAAIRKTGTTLAALCQAHGLNRASINCMWHRPWPRVQAIVAKHLGLLPQDIWPSRYDPDGEPLRGLHRGRSAKPSRPAPTPHRQKSEAA